MINPDHVDELAKRIAREVAEYVVNKLPIRIDRDANINHELAQLEPVIARVLREAPAYDRWLPIETAPKDGTNFLALTPFKKKNHQIVGCFAPSGVFVSWPGRWRYSPTHWMPLPDPPHPSE